MKRSWNLFSPVPEQEARRIDRLVRLNLAPLMGRRDAAYDQVSRLLRTDFFSFSEDERLEIYDKILELLHLAGEFTRQLLNMMTSRDTAKKEQNLLSYFTILASNVRMLGNFIELENRAFRPQEAFNELVPESSLIQNEQMLTETEIALVNQLRSIFQRSDPAAHRYRAFAVHNLSRDNADRYRTAFEAYSRLYAKNYQVNPTQTIGVSN